MQQNKTNGRKIKNVALIMPFRAGVIASLGHADETRWLAGGAAAGVGAAETWDMI